MLADIHKNLQPKMTLTANCIDRARNAKQAHAVVHFRDNRVGRAFALPLIADLTAHSTGEEGRHAGGALGRRPRRADSDRLAGEHAALQLHRLGARLHAELGHQRAAAGEELPQCVAAAPASCVRGDQAPVGRLVQRVELDQAPRGAGRGHVVAGRRRARRSSAASTSA